MTRDLIGACTSRYGQIPVTESVALPPRRRSQHVQRRTLQIYQPNKSLGQDAAISIKRATALMGLAHALETLAFQIDRLAIIMNEEGK